MKKQSILLAFLLLGATFCSQAQSKKELEIQTIVEGLVLGNYELLKYKSLNKEERLKFVKISDYEAKSLGKTIKIRNDWDTVKFDVMY